MVAETFKARWWVRLRDLDRSWGLFVSYYYKDRRVSALHFQVWPKFELRAVWKADEGGTWLFQFPRR